MTEAKPIGGGYCVYVPTYRERFWRWLGFRYHLGDEPEGPELQGWMQTVAGLRLGIADRLRLLVSGHLRIKLTMSLDTPSAGYRQNPNGLGNQSAWRHNAMNLYVGGR